MTSADPHGDGSVPVEGEQDRPQSPYDIGLLGGEEETGPKPLDTELEHEQVQEES